MYKIKLLSFIILVEFSFLFLYYNIIYNKLKNYLDNLSFKFCFFLIFEDVGGEGGRGKVGWK